MAWLIRDGRRLLAHVQGNCVYDEDQAHTLGLEELSADNYVNCTAEAESSDERSSSATWFYIIILKILGIN